MDQSGWSPIGCLPVTPSAQFRLILEVTEYILKKTKPNNNIFVVTISYLVRVYDGYFMLTKQGKNVGIKKKKRKIL